MSNVTYVRWQKDQPRECRDFAPLAPDHPSAGTPCFVCGEVLGNGQPVQLLAIGPEGEEDRARHAAGRWYSAVAILLHVRCLTGDDNPGDAS